MARREEGPDAWLLPHSDATRMEVVTVSTDDEVGWAVVTLRPAEVVWTIMQAGGSIQINGP
eukprot:3735294-Prorocentrum_lima.AAC.1